MKKLLTAGLGLLLALPAYSYDFGLNVSEIPVWTGGQSTFYVQSAEVEGYLNSPLYGGTLALAAYGTYTIQTTSLSDAWTAAKYQDFNLSQASYSEIDQWGNSVVQWSVGRRAVADSSGGWINASVWDGADWTQTIGRFHWQVAGGYSGFQPKLSSKVSASPEDVLDYSDDSVFWAPNRLYASSQVGLIEAFARQDLNLEVIGDYDLRSGSNAVHGGYAVLSSGGPLPLGVRQQSFAASSVYSGDHSFGQGLLAGTELSLNIPDIGARVAWSAMGTKGFGPWDFRALAGLSMGDVLTLPTYDTGITSLSMSARPLSTLTVGGKLSGLFRTGSSDLSISGYDLSTNQILIGGEASVNASWTPTSDLVLSGTFGIFLPNSAAFVSGTNPTYLGAGVFTLKL